MNEYVMLPIVGAAVSVLVQFIKNTSYVPARAAVVGLAAVAGGIFWQFGDTELWNAFLQVLVYANGIYAFVIAYFE